METYKINLINRSMEWNGLRCDGKEIVRVDGNPLTFQDIEFVLENVHDDVINLMEKPIFKNLDKDDIIWKWQNMYGQSVFRTEKNEYCENLECLRGHENLFEPVYKEIVDKSYKSTCRRCDVRDGYKCNGCDEHWCDDCTVKRFHDCEYSRLSEENIMGSLKLIHNRLLLELEMNKINGVAISEHPPHILVFTSQTREQVIESIGLTDKTLPIYTEEPLVFSGGSLMEACEEII